MDKFSFFQGQFIASAYETDQLPLLVMENGSPMPEIAIVGRSNVGKSSLINSLFKGQKLAKTSATPGKTQSINFFSIDQKLALVDLPGYGYAKVSLQLKAKWALLIENYLKSRKTLKLILFLMDSRRTPTEEDSQFMQWANHHRIPLLLIFTKSDKVNEREKKDSTLNCLETFHRFLHSAPIRFLHYSIKDPRARIELIQQINSLLGLWAPLTKIPSFASTVKPQG